MTWLSIMVLALVMFVCLSDIHSGLIAVANAIRSHQKPS